MLVKNNTRSVVGSHLRLGPKGTRTLVTLKPGLNDIDTDAWAQLRGLAPVAHMLEHGELVDLSSKSPEAAAPQVSLAKMNAGDAVAIVKQTFDTPTLERWATEDERATVLKAIEKQLDSVDAKKGSGAGDAGAEDDEGADSDDDEG